MEILISEEGTLARRNDYNKKPEGRCCVMSEEPMAKSVSSSGSPIHYAEVKIETDTDTWSGGLDLAITALPPDQNSQEYMDSLAWAEIEQTWVIRDQGNLRLKGRGVPVGAVPGLKMRGWATQHLEMGDTVGLLVEQGCIKGYVNGQLVGRLDTTEFPVPVDGDLWLMADVIGKACGIYLLDTKLPAGGIDS